MNTGRPNIVFISADQLGAKWLGCYGSGIDSTPVLDRLAHEGMRFDRCYANFPLCAPSRATFLSGRSVYAHGVVTNNHCYPPGLPTYAHILRRTGYRTGGFGKFHQRPMHLPVEGDAAYLGFDESLVTEDPKWPWYDWVKKKFPEHAETALSMCWRWPTMPPRAESERAQELRSALHRKRHDTYGWSWLGPSPLPSEMHDTTYITNLGLDFMQRHTREHGGRHFICHISYVDPHDPYDPPQDYADIYSPADMPEPLAAEWIEDGIEFLRIAQENNNFDSLYEKTEITAALRALYHSSLKYMDDQIGRIVDWLQNSGLWKNTILLFTTDHGEMLGDHGHITKGAKHYDAGIRCPMIVGGGPVSRGTSDDLVCTLDLAPTFCDWAGTAEQDIPPLEGRSFAPQCRGKEPDEWRNAVFIGGGNLSSVITDDGWRLTHYPRQKQGQMFNLNEDPDELYSLYADPAHAQRKTALLETLVDVSCSGLTRAHYRNLPVYEETKFMPQGGDAQSGFHIYGDV